MTASSYGTKNEPKFADADAPDLAVNPTQVAAYAAKVGNRRTGTTAERNAATGLDVWEGLLWGDTTDGVEYRRTAGAWKAWYSDWRVYSAALTGLNVGTGGTNYTESRYLAGTIAVRYKFVLGSSGFSVGTNPNFTLPVGALVGPNPVEAYAGFSSLYDLSATVGFVSMVSAYTGGNARIFVLGSAGAYSPITATAPFTFASGDVLSGEFTYKAA